MRNFILLVALFLSMTIQSANAHNGKPVTSTIDIVCTTTADLTGLNMASVQILEGKDSQGNSVYVSCTTVHIVSSSPIEITLTTTENLSGIEFLDLQTFDFVDPATGVVQSFDFIVEDMVIH